MPDEPETQGDTAKEGGLPVEMLSEIVTQIEDLVKLATECETRPTAEGAPLTETMNRIVELQQQIQVLHDTSMEFIKNLGLAEEELQVTEDALAKLSPAERRLVTRINQLTKSCETEREKMYQLMRRDKRTVKQATEELKKENLPKSRRRGKFKSLGGGWIPT